jgi:hypothetical protein
MRATDKDAVVFCGAHNIIFVGRLRWQQSSVMSRCWCAGSGATAGFDKLVHILGLRKAGVENCADSRDAAKFVCAFPGCARRFRDSGDLKLHQRTHRDGDFHSVGTAASAALAEVAGRSGEEDGRRPLVIVGPYAHHSNLLPWIESIADITFVPEAAGAGGVDMAVLETVLTANTHRTAMVGAFTAASNVTGATVDVDAVTRLIHVHGGVVVWDFAAAAPHMPIGKVAGTC